MYNTDMPSREELPSSAKLIRSTIIAAVVALLLLVTVVMPAEYALDPTGAGRLLGLTEMGEIKEQLAEEAAADQAAELVAVPSQVEESAPEEEIASAEDRLEGARAGGETAPEVEASAASSAVAAEPPAATVETAMGESENAARAELQWQDEVRVVLTPGEGTEFKLTMDEGAVARFSWVSEGGPINFDTHGDGNGRSISYEKGRGVSADEGELVAAFAGNHGWFFRNRNGSDITLVLRAGGDYGQLKKLK